MSLRQKYYIRFIFRIIVLLVVVILFFFYPNSFNVMNGFEFFNQFSILHIFWVIWMADMIFQLIPLRNNLPLGSQKQFPQYYIPLPLKGKDRKLNKFIRASNIVTLKVFIFWLALILFLEFFTLFGWLGNRAQLLLSAIFYVCDIICVLFWCPFRVFIVKNKCCTTCRIFNWDHLMMFSPMIFVKGFYSISLFSMAFIVFIIWEVFFITHPERFYEETNAALHCANCTDRLCKKNLNK